MSEPTAALVPDVGGFMNVWGVDYVDNCFQIAAFALCIYEYLVTLDLEITRVWGRSRKVSVVTLIFIVNRYACLCYVGSDLVQLAAWGDVSSATANKICNITTRVKDLCEDVIYLGLALFTALRTYAIWDRNWKVFACVLVPGLVYPIGSIYINVVTTYRSRGTTGCYWEIHFKFPADSDGPGGSRKRDYDVFYIVGRCIAILFECVALSLTWAKVIPVVRHLRRHNFSSTFIISRCFLYNGTIQFSVILLTTTFNLLGLLSPTVGDTAVFVTTLASILVSRFILDLREEQGDDDLRVPQFSNIDFAPGVQDPGDVEDSTIRDG